jgi:sulfur carrier protein
MRIFVNGAARDIGAQTLELALIELGFVEATIATALNEQFVAATARETQVLAAGDRLEILAPMQGG